MTTQIHPLDGTNWSSPNSKDLYWAGEPDFGSQDLLKLQVFGNEDRAFVRFETGLRDDDRVSIPPENEDQDGDVWHGPMIDMELPDLLALQYILDEAIKAIVKHQ